MISKIKPHLAYVATLLCESLMSAKQAINDKLQGSVAAYLRCGGVEAPLKLRPYGAIQICLLLLLLLLLLN